MFSLQCCFHKYNANPRKFSRAGGGGGGGLGTNGRYNTPHFHGYPHPPPGLEGGGTWLQMTSALFSEMFYSQPKQFVYKVFISSIRKKPYPLFQLSLAILSISGNTKYSYSNICNIDDSIVINILLNQQQN